MVTPGYIGRQFRAIVAMLRGQAWERQLDMSAEGVFRSFWAVPLSMPFAVLTHFMTVPVLQLSPAYDELNIPELPMAFSAAVQIVQLMASWAIVMFLLVGLSQQLKSGTRVSPLIVSYNWSVLLLQMIICAGVLIVAPVRQVDLLIMFYLAMMILWLFVRWCLIRQTLQSGLGPTIGIMVMVFLATQLMGSVVTNIGNGMYQYFSSPAEEAWQAPQDGVTTE